MVNLQYPNKRAYLLLELYQHDWRKGNYRSSYITVLLLLSSSMHCFEEQMLIVFIARESSMEYS